jgi:16S rRNA G966 N2-methylase RsmD
MIYFEEGKIVAESGDIKVYKMGDEFFLEKGPGHNLWIDTYENKDLKKQIGDKPFGNCLELGLGLGMVSAYILSFSAVENLTTVEIDADVINVYKQLNPIVDDRHKIINSDAVRYLDNVKEMFDFIFMDHYSIIDEDTIDMIEYSYNMAKRCISKEGSIVMWFDDYTPDEFAEKFFNLIDNNGGNSYD